MARLLVTCFGLSEILERAGNLNHICGLRVSELLNGFGRAVTGTTAPLRRRQCSPNALPASNRHDGRRHNRWRRRPGVSPRMQLMGKDRLHGLGLIYRWDESEALALARPCRRLTSLRQPG